MQSGGFSPASLFAGGIAGAWYDPSDLSTLFQDSAGTTPVTASGQPVGKMLDKSGNGNHATQATSAKRPTYTAGGGLHWLAFDGTDDAMATAAIDFTGTDKVSVFAGVRRVRVSDDITRVIADLGNDPTTVNGSFSAAGRNTYYNTPYWGEIRGTSRVYVDSGSFTPDSAPVTRVLTYEYDIAQTAALTIKARVDGVSQTLALVGVSAGSGNFGNHPLFIGARNQSTFYFNGNMYGLIIPGKMAYADEIASTEAYMAAKSGVTL